MVNIVELLALAVVLVAALWAPRKTRDRYQRLAKSARRYLARVNSSAWIGLIVFVALAAYGTSVRLPDPSVRDEFSYLLAADTFAAGRLTNPAHPLGEHFATWHVLVNPTYQSKYHPAQGLFLAAGQVVFGKPIVGVWISLALACAAVHWMLRGWLPPRWALYGTVVTALGPGLFFWWGQTFWGGAVAMLGGALVLGAFPRIKHTYRSRDAVILAAGLVILANSRPYEGLIVSLPIALALLAWMFGSQSPAWTITVRRLVLPIVGVVLTGLAATAVYNNAVTGDPFLMPYRLYLTQHELSVGNVLGLSSIDGEDLAKNGEILVERAHMKHRNVDFHPLVRLARPILFYLRLSLCLPMLALPWMLRRRRNWLPFAITVMVCSAVLLTPTRGWAHYYAPVTCLFALLVVEGARQLRQVNWRGRAMGRLLVPAIPLVCGISLLWSIVKAWPEMPFPPSSESARLRVDIERALAQDDVKDCVIVRRATQEEADFEWVYNRADIDRAEVVWARDLGDTKNQDLCEYYPHRRIWLFEPDKDPRRLEPYRELSSDSKKRGDREETQSMIASKAKASSAKQNEHAD